MGDKKPKKNSSGNADAYKAKQNKSKFDAIPPPPDDKNKGRKK